MFAVIGVIVFFLANSSREDAPNVGANVPSPYEADVFNTILDDLEEKTGDTEAFTMVARWGIAGRLEKWGIGRGTRPAAAPTTPPYG